jgi:cytoskeletal protein CcmA (bactofilin family)
VIGNNKAGSVGGYDLVRAIQQQREKKGGPPPPGQRERPAPKPVVRSSGGSGGAGGPKIGKTALPNLYEYVCYNCGYRFKSAGKTPTLICIKCRTVLNQSDHQVTSRQEGTLLTAGVVKIMPEGIWAGGRLMAREVVIEGRHEGGEINASQKVEFAAGSAAKLSGIFSELLVIRAGAEIEGDGAQTYREVVLEGSLRGRIAVSGTMTIKAGGSFSGKLSACNLVLEEGGGISGDIEINPAWTEPVETTEADEEQAQEAKPAASPALPPKIKL